MRLLVFLAVAAAPVSLGPVLTRDGYRWRPPAGFQATPVDEARGSRAFIPGGALGSGQGTSALLVDGPGEDATSIVIALFDTPPARPGAGRDTLSDRVAEHFRERLELDFTLERAHGRLADRADVVGSVTLGGQVRRVMVQGVEQAGRSAWLIAAAPTARWEDALPAIEASFATFQFEAPPPARPAWLGPAAVTLAIALLAAGAWRRTRARR